VILKNPSTICASVKVFDSAARRALISLSWMFCARVAVSGEPRQRINAMAATRLVGAPAPA
jgi:hypothetical protein